MILPDRKSIQIGLLLAMAVSVSAFFLYNRNRPEVGIFDEMAAFRHISALEAIGPRVPNSDAHQKARDYIAGNLTESGWVVTEQTFTYNNITGTNIIASIGKPGGILLAAHYDSRMVADKESDPAKAILPVPGANDGASGTAILLELANCIRMENNNIQLVFFDLEDQGNIPGWNWILGSRAFVDKMSVSPTKMVLLDMVGAKDARFYYEVNSNEAVSTEIWETAHQLGYGNIFIKAEKFSVLDDHIPFVERGIPAVDIIGLDDPNWHTLADTKENISTSTLKAVGNTVCHWVNNTATQVP